MVDGFLGRYVRYKTGLKPWGSQSGNTILVVILLSYGFMYLRTKMPETYTALKAYRLVTFSRSPAVTASRSPWRPHETTSSSLQ